MEEYYSDRPVLDPGEVVSSVDGDYSFRVIEHIGEGRCCLVYSARSVRDGTKVALKVFKRGPNYDGAVQREQYILDAFQNPKHNIVLCFGYFVYNGLHCQVMELLEYNIRQLIFRNDRQGLSPWLTQKCARDLLTSLAALHENSFVHADLKPANVMWSSYDGCFKLLDFGLTFHTEETDLHQIQSSGYKSPESAEWNKFKDDEKRKRKRKLQGTYSDLTTAAPAFSGGLNEITPDMLNMSNENEPIRDLSPTPRIELKDTSSNAQIQNHSATDNAQTIMENSLKNIITQDQPIKNQSPLTTSEAHSISSSSSSSVSHNTSKRKPPPKSRLSCVIPSSDAGSGLNIYVRQPRQRKVDGNQEISARSPHTTSTFTTTECQETIDNAKKWPSESSGVYTASSHCITPSGSTSVAEVDPFSPVSSTRETNEKIKSTACYRNEMALSKGNENVHGGSQQETNISLTSCSSLTTSCSTQSGCHSLCNTTPTTESICYSCCDVECSKRNVLNSGASSRTSLDPSLSSLNSSVSYTSSVISPCTSQSCCSSAKSKQSCDSSDAVDLSQEWRRGRSSKKDVSGRKCPRPVSTCTPKLDERKPRNVPFMPDEKADIWSFGCLLVEALTGRKMFSASDKMASILKPLQLLEMRIGETECRYHAVENQADGRVDRHKFFDDAKDLIQSCLTEDPSERISAKLALQHKFFSDHELLPTLKDMVLLPTNVLRLLNVLDDPKYKNDDNEIKDLLTEVREEAEKFGRVTDIKSNGGHAYVEFQEASDCQRAVTGLTGTTYEDRAVMAVFYPICLWSQNILLL